MNKLNDIDVELKFDGDGFTKHILGFIKDRQDCWQGQCEGYIIDSVNTEISDVIEKFCEIDLKEKPSKFTKEEIAIIDRKSHLDATHVGIIGNPYFYVCLGGLDYYFKDGDWRLCDWSEQTNQSELGYKDQFVPIKFGE